MALKSKWVTAAEAIFTKDNWQSLNEIFLPEGMKKCKCEVLVPLRSINKKMCPDCKAKYEWNLDPGQRPLITSSKDRGL